MPRCVVVSVFFVVCVDELFVALAAFYFSSSAFAVCCRRYVSRRGAGATFPFGGR